MHSLVWTNFSKFVQVREIVSVLDLDVLFYPCPKNGPNFRRKVMQMGGKQQFPYMVWPYSYISFELQSLLQIYRIMCHGCCSGKKKNISLSSCRVWGSLLSKRTLIVSCIESRNKCVSLLSPIYIVASSLWFQKVMNHDLWLDIGVGLRCFGFRCSFFAISINKQLEETWLKFWWTSKEIVNRHLEPSKCGVQINEHQWTSIQGSGILIQHELKLLLDNTLAHLGGHFSHCNGPMTTWLPKTNTTNN